VAVPDTRLTDHKEGEMGFLDKLLGRARQTAGSVASGGSLNPEQMMEQEASAAKQSAEAAPQNAQAGAQRSAERQVEGTDR
jgi:hypothetical protein